MKTCFSYCHRAVETEVVIDGADTYEQNPSGVSRHLKSWEDAENGTVATVKERGKSDV